MPSRSLGRRLRRERSEEQCALCWGYLRDAPDEVTLSGMVERSVTVELESAVGPRVIVVGEWEPEEIEAELPEGWTVGSNWHLASQCGGGTSYPIVKTAARLLADELIAVSVEETLRRWVAEGDIGQLHQHESLMQARLGGDYDPTAWDDAFAIIATRFNWHPPADCGVGTSYPLVRPARKDQVMAFARSLAKNDAKACALGGTEMDGVWGGEHTTALADHLGCTPRELTTDDLAWAKEAYAVEAQRG